MLFSSSPRSSLVSGSCWRKVVRYVIQHVVIAKVAAMESAEHDDSLFKTIFKDSFQGICG